MIAALSERVAITPLRSWLVKAVSYALSRARIGSNSGFSAPAWASGVCALATDGTAAAAAMVAIPKMASFRFITAIIPQNEYATQLSNGRTFLMIFASQEKCSLQGAFESRCILPIAQNRAHETKRREEAKLAGRTLNALIFRRPTVPALGPRRHRSYSAPSVDAWILKKMAYNTGVTTKHRRTASAKPNISPAAIDPKNGS